MSRVQAITKPAAGTDGTPFGHLLKEWCNRRRLSQLDLALAIGSTCGICALLSAVARHPAAT
jgi:hypothetical protein